MANWKGITLGFTVAVLVAAIIIMLGIQPDLFWWFPGHQ